MSFDANAGRSLGVPDKDREIVVELSVDGGSGGAGPDLLLLQFGSGAVLMGDQPTVGSLDEDDGLSSIALHLLSIFLESDMRIIGHNRHVSEYVDLHILGVDREVRDRREERCLRFASFLEGLSFVLPGAEFREFRGIEVMKAQGPDIAGHSVLMDPSHRSSNLFLSLWEAIINDVTIPRLRWR